MIHALVLATAIAAIPVAAQVRDWHDASSDAVTHAAKRGDKRAALELGKRYESGSGGLSCDAGQARRWYGSAARSTGGRRFAYSAPVGKERVGRMVDIGGAPVSPGLPEASERLAALRSAERRPSGDGCLAPAVGAAPAPHPTRLPAAGVAGQDRGAGAPLCDAPYYPLRIAARRETDAVVVLLDCIRDDRPGIVKATRRVPLAGATAPPMAFDDLNAPPLSLRQEVWADLHAKFFHVKLESSAGHCAPLRATPVAETPIPVRYLDADHRWYLSVGYLATPDCSSIVVWAGNRFVLLQPADGLSRQLYQVRISFE